MKAYYDSLISNVALNYPIDFVKSVSHISHSNIIKHLFDDIAGVCVASLPQLDVMRHLKHTTKCDKNETQNT